MGAPRAPSPSTEQGRGEGRGPPQTSLAGVQGLTQCLSNITLAPIIVSTEGASRWQTPFIPSPPSYSSSLSLTLWRLPLSPALKIWGWAQVKLMPHSYTTSVGVVSSFMGGELKDKGKKKNYFSLYTHLYSLNVILRS